MKILVANLGSTSLKWRLFDFANGREQMLHKGGFARVIRIRVAANGETVAAYAADGLVVSTPTGSTITPRTSGGPATSARTGRKSSMASATPSAM